MIPNETPTSNASIFQQGDVAMIISTLACPFYQILVNYLNSDPDFLPLCLCATRSPWPKKRCLNLVKFEQQPVGAVVSGWPAEKCQLLCSCVSAQL